MSFEVFKLSNPQCGSDRMIFRRDLTHVNTPMRGVR
jgi:hypothetical protein